MQHAFRRVKGADERREAVEGVLVDHRAGGPHVCTDRSVEPPDVGSRSQIAE
jgi:hypothetical protein